MSSLSVSEEQLTDPKVHPNPELKQLLDTNRVVHGLSLDALQHDIEIAMLYETAYRQILDAIVTLYKIKNKLTEGE